jgi:hypothetical protein
LFAQLTDGNLAALVWSWLRVVTGDRQCGTILLVEDEPADAQLLMRAFQRAGVQNPIKHLSRGDTALGYLEGVSPYSDRVLHPLPILMILDLKTTRHVQTGVAALDLATAASAPHSCTGPYIRN